MVLFAGECPTENEVERLRPSIQRFKPFGKEMLGEHCETGFYTLKFHLLDHVIVDLERLGFLDVLDTSPFERFNVYIKRACRTPSQRLSSGMEEAIRALNLRREEGLRKMKHIETIGCSAAV